MSFITGSVTQSIETRAMKWTQHIARMGGKMDKFIYRILMGKPRGTRLLGRPRCRLENNIKIDLNSTTLNWCRPDLSDFG
jgi:hypothetical protein